MLIKYRLLASLFIIGTSCNNAKQESPERNTDTVQEATPIAPALPLIQCYENRLGSDTVRLRVTDSSGFVTGHLDYRLAGKDANTGTFKGRMYGDTLIAEYTFRSEGVRSVREIAFLRKDQVLIEGFGPVKMVKSHMKFKSMDSLSFNEVNRLLPVSCE